MIDILAGGYIDYNTGNTDNILEYDITGDSYTQIGTMTRPGNGTPSLWCSIGTSQIGASKCILIEIACVVRGSKRV